MSVGRVYVLILFFFLFFFFIMIEGEIGERGSPK